MGTGVGRAGFGWWCFFGGIGEEGLSGWGFCLVCEDEIECVTFRGVVLLEIKYTIVL